MAKQYIGSQEHFEDEIDAYYDKKEEMEREMQKQYEKAMMEQMERDYYEQMEREYEEYVKLQNQKELEKMTDKQYNFLRKYISEELIKEIKESKSALFVSNCVGFIIKTQDKHSTIFDITVDLKLHENLKQKVAELEKKINKNRQLYSGPNDEHYSFKCAYSIPESGKLYFVFVQSWCKGMSEGVTRKYLKVNENGDEIKYNIQYEELFRLNINTLSLFFEYLKRNNFSQSE